MIINVERNKVLEKEMTTDPFKVHYQHGGNMFLLHWWTYSERGHIILANSEQSIFATAKRVFFHHPDAEIRRYLSIEVVAPSNFVNELASHYDRKEAIQSFVIDITFHINELIENGVGLPPGFEVCKNFQPVIGGEEAADYWVDRHHNCKNCVDKLILPAPPEALYHQYGRLWDELKNPESKNSWNDKRVFSKARVPDDDEPVWAALALFGHHSSGIDIEKVDLCLEDLNDKNRMRPRTISRDVLFYFRKTGDVDRAPVNELLKTALKNRRAEKSASETKYKQQLKAEKQARIKMILDLFSDTNK